MCCVIKVGLSEILVNEINGLKRRKGLEEFAVTWIKGETRDVGVGTCREPFSPVNISRG